MTIIRSAYQFLLGPNRWVAGCIAVLAVAFLTPAQAGAGQSRLESLPAPQPITIDGVAEDWAEVPLVYLEESVRVFGVAHDADALYLMFRFGDERLAERMLRGGVTIWVNGDDKKKESFGLRYGGSKLIAESLGPRPGDESGRGGPPDSEGGGRGESPGSRGRVEPGVITVLMDGGELRETFLEDGPSGPRVASTVVDDLFVYEMVLPFEVIGGEVVEDSPEKKRKVRIGVQVGGLSRAEREEMREAASGGQGGFGGMGGGGRSGGMGGGRGGGMGGGGRGGGGSPMRSRGEIPEIQWMKVTLAPVNEGEPG